MNKTDDYSQNKFSNAFDYLFCILNQSAQIGVPNGPVDDNIPLAHVMAWCQIGDRPLIEPMMIQLVCTNMRHQALIC